MKNPSHGEDVYGLLRDKRFYGLLDGDTPFPTTYAKDDKMPYLSGVKICDLSRTLGLPVNASGMSRWSYIEDMLDYAVEHSRFSDFLCLFFNSPYFAEHLADAPFGQYEARHDAVVQGVIDQINRMLHFGGHELRTVNGQYLITEIGETPHIEAPSIKKMGSAYVHQMAERANNDVDNGRLDSAITQSRTLIEEAFIYAIEQKGLEPSKTGDIAKLYSQVKDLYNMHESGDADKRINMLIGGLNKIVDAISQMRNNDSDAHGLGSRRINISDYHARLAVNSSVAVVDFILSVVAANKSRST
ncbi:MAG: abortive infection family protein [Atopobiaceae bacterium]|nr:abortive infection family protein [Atopobiaceae bacterium]